MSGEVVAAVVAVDDDVDLEVDGLEQCSIHFLSTVMQECFQNLSEHFSLSKVSSLSIFRLLLS